MKKRPLAFKDAIHENADRFCDGEHDREENHYLCYSRQTHISPSKALRPQQCIHQVNEQEDGNDSCDGVFHRILLFLSVGPTVRIVSVRRFAASLLPSGPPRLKAFGGFREAPHQSKEDNDDNDVENIKHDSPHWEQHDLMAGFR
jgi:hypothetical protein